MRNFPLAYFVRRTGTHDAAKMVAAHDLARREIAGQIFFDEFLGGVGE
jgi:hypothetical protein